MVRTSLKKTSLLGAPVDDLVKQRFEQASAKRNLKPAVLMRDLIEQAEAKINALRGDQRLYEVAVEVRPLMPQMPGSAYPSYPHPA